VPLVPDPNCDGRGWIPVYDPGRSNADGSPVMIGTRPDPRCAGTGMVLKPEVFPYTKRFVEAEAGYTDEVRPKNELV
jgi:hypothetical protein